KVLEAGGPERLLHVYGPTETTTFATWQLVTEVAEEAVTIPIGQPIGNTTVYLLDKTGEPVPVGVAGELYIGGPGVARGYLNRTELTRERFVEDRFSGKKGARLYRTGDLGRRRSDGAIEFVGRTDNQVKIRGFRIELGEIGSVLERHAGIEQALVVVRDADGDKRLVAYVVPKAGAAPSVVDLRRYLAEKLPDYMVPASLLLLERMPLNANGKIDQPALPDWRAGLSEERRKVELPQSALQRQIAEIWRELLHVERVGSDDNFFDLGGHSLLLTKVHARLVETLRREIAIVDLFKYPTVSSLAAYLGDGGSGREESQPVSVRSRKVSEREPIAIVAMAGRFPGAKSVEELWQNIAAGKEGIRFFSADELIAAGVDPQLVNHPQYVRAGAPVDDPEMFDAGFFGVSAREAEITDPQQRLFLECAHQVLESAGIDPHGYSGLIGVFAGATMSSYLTANIQKSPSANESSSPLQIFVGNDKDFLATRVSYKLNLKGPSVAVQSACSTSLVAVHLACQSLLEGACDVALAGGVSVRFPLHSGYFYEPEGILSPDGHCRAFDANSQGTVPGNGVAIVVLKRLSDAQADGDDILAVIRGSAINNDGSLKVGYTAPSVEGQAKVIAAAQAAAGVAPETISYIEAHGTGTALGDPIEVAALTQAFGKTSRRGQYCAMGSLKSNVGHMDAAAGAAGLIKVVLQMQHRELAPSLHYEQPNPKIDFANSPFYVNAALRKWEAAEGEPRRAGVSSFGIGGTNAHVIVEEAPQKVQSGTSRPRQLLTLSAKTAKALDRAAENLAEYLESHREAELADVAYTQMVGRTAHAYRRVVVCRTREEAVAGLQSAEKSAWTEKAEGT
ncbi:MAG TPA: beta-ketoacyl synthase N-terminal-like domain-containing protein, partial [Verrucomicrobiae bacterium]|nr:beta-ketoacyl synthase N-terminal-like domain-containing protein [Verrucomicrobiae bacterium]